MMKRRAKREKQNGVQSVDKKNKGRANSLFMAEQGSSSRMLNSLPHFFQPLLPGFRDHFSIPDGFGKYLEGREVGEEIAVLRSPSGKIYRAKMQKGRAFRDGWKEFVDEYDLHVGDLVVFRLVAAPMVFDVMIFDPSACERPYLPQNVDVQTEEEEKEEQEEMGLPCAADLPEPEPGLHGGGGSGTPMERIGKDGPSSEPKKPYFAVSVNSDNLKNFRLHIPKYFAKKNDLNAMSTEAVILNEEGASWPVMIKCYCRPASATYIQRGWRAFQKENDLKLGDTFTLELVQGGQKLVLRMSGLHANPVLEREYREKARMERRKNVKEVKKEAIHHDQDSRAAGFSDMADAHFMLTITSRFLAGIDLRIPDGIARYSGLYGESQALLLTNEKGGEWLVTVKTSTNGITYIASGWTKLVKETGLTVGDTLRVDLVKRGMNPVMSFKVVSRNPSVPKEDKP